MVRTRRPLVERMTLVWHDWFATSNCRRRLAEADARAEPAPAPQRARPLRSPARRDHRQPRDAALALRHGQPQGRPERELRPRADGAVHPRRGQRVHREGRPRAGARAHRLDEHLDAEQGPDQLPLRSDPARPGREDRVRQAGQLRLAGLGLALRPPPEARGVLRRQAVELLRSRPAGCEDAGRPRRDLRARLRGATRARGDPPASGALHRPAHGQVPRRLHRRAPARARPRDRHDGVGVARRGGRPAPLLPAQRCRLGRLALARHEHVPRPLVDRQHRAREGLDRRPQGQEGAEGAERPRGDRQGRAGRAREPDDPARDASRAAQRSPEAR